MLVVTRKPGESIVIGENIVVEVVAVEGRRVRVGVDAPREIAVKRAEIVEEKKPDRSGDEDANPGGDEPGDSSGS